MVRRVEIEAREKRRMVMRRLERRVVRAVRCVEKVVVGRGGDLGVDGGEEGDGEGDGGGRREVRKVRV